MTIHHTPGPWEVRRAEPRDIGPWENYSTITLPGFGGLTPIALIPTHARAHTAAEHEVNARLISAAPDLLAAAAALLAKIDNMTSEQFSRGDERPEREALRAAIAKATGGAS